MRACKTIVVGAVLPAALIVTIAVAASNGFEFRRSATDYAPSSHQQQTSVVDLVTPAEKIDLAERPDAEPWGPFRATDW